ASLRTRAATQRLIDEERYDVVVAHHGIYVPQGIICETARRCGTRVVTYNPAYRKHCFIFSHEASYHYTMLDEETAVWENLDLRPELQSVTQNYLKSRRTGSADWIWFHDEPRENAAAVLREIGADPDK